MATRFSLEECAFRQTLYHLMPNIAAIKAMTPYPALQTLRMYESTGRERFSGWLAITELIARPVRNIDMQCGACSSPIGSLHVPSMVCPHTKYHPACAAVLVRILGHEEVFMRTGLCRLNMIWYDEAGEPRKRLKSASHEHSSALADRVRERRRGAVARVLALI